MSSNTRPLNILQFICSTGFYGAERWILALSNNLDPAQVRCDLAVTLERESKDLEIVRKYRSDFHHIGTAHEIPMSHRFDMRAISRLMRIIRARKIDIIHTHGYKSDIIGVIAARRAGIRCVMTPHGFENALDFKLKLFGWLGGKAMRYADRVVPLSPQLLEDLKSYRIPEKKLVYIQNGVDLSEVDSVRDDKRSFVAKGDIKRIGYIGQMISRKNLGDVLETFEILRLRHESLELMLLGDGEDRELLEAQARRLECREDIHFMGFRDNRLEYLKSFDLFVMTSTLEGIPRCMMEAMAMGVPVAAYDIPGVDQLIENEITGLLAPMGDKDSMARQWERLLSDSQFANSIAAQARDFVHNRFSAKRMADEYLELFSQLVNSLPLR